MINYISSFLDLLNTLHNQNPLRVETPYKMGRIIDMLRKDHKVIVIKTVQYNLKQ